MLVAMNLISPNRSSTRSSELHRNSVNVLNDLGDAKAADEINEQFA